MRKLSIITLVVLVIALGSGILYFQKRGAFQDPEIKVTTAPAYVIAGKNYKGKMTNKAFGELFNSAEKLVAEKKIKGTVAGIFYNNPENATDIIESFVGVIMNDTNEVLPEGYTKKYLPSRKVVEARVANLYGSPLIYPKVDDYAKEHNIKLLNIPALEVYPPTKEVYVQVPIDTAVQK
jgi:hypothetical protein